MQFKTIFIFLILVLTWSNTAVAAVFTVSKSGGDYSSIQACANSASSGDICLVKPGTYSEDVDVSRSGIIFKAENAPNSAAPSILDGGSKKQYAFSIKSSNVQVIGFMIKNYHPTTSRSGVVYFSGTASNGGQAKYNYFTSNTIDTADTGAISAKSADNVIIRGNIFSGNRGLNSSSQSLIYGCYGSDNVLIELNKCLDITSNNARFIYWTTNSNNAIIQYNYTKSYSRLRMSKNHQVLNNIFDNSEVGLELHDQCGVTTCPNKPSWSKDNCEDYDSSRGGCVEDSDENHVVKNNTFYKGGRQIRPIRMDNVEISNNLFIDPNIYAIDREWGGCTTTDIRISGNLKDNVGKWHNLSSSEYSESGTETCNSNYNKETGLHTCDQSRYGANLRIDHWPFTDKDGRALSSDYPYSGSFQYISLPQDGIAPPSGLKILKDN